MRVEMELRNIPRQRVMQYLEEAGGQRVGPLAVAGAGWSAHLEEMEPAVITVMTIRRDLLVIEGDDPDAVDVAHAFMRRKTMRGGG